MNTGSGKTVVALMILRSCLNEGKGPAVYVVPDSYLVSQVIGQAKMLGIETTTDENNLGFIRGKTILVINIYALVNGKSKYGMRNYGNIGFGSVIIDDIHACISVIQNQFTVTIDKNCNGYDKIIKIFEKDLKKQSESKLMDIISPNNPYGNMLVPFWSWQEHTLDILKIITEERNKSKTIDFSIDLIKDVLKLCRCYIDAKKYK